MMPDFRVIPSEEAAQMQTRRGRSVDLSQYLSHLRVVDTGQMGEATLSANEKKATVKRRLTTAAKQLGKGLKYRRSGETRVVYEVTEPKERRAVSP
jgi:hypothetical protein